MFTDADPIQQKQSANINKTTTTKEEGEQTKKNLWSIVSAYAESKTLTL